MLMLGFRVIAPCHGQLTSSRRITLGEVGTTQVPGGARAGCAELDGAASHPAVQVIHYAHQLRAALPVGVALRRFE